MNIAVGQKIITLVPNANTTSEKTGTILTITKVSINGEFFWTESTRNFNERWIFSKRDFINGKIQYINIEIFEKLGD